MAHHQADLPQSKPAARELALDWCAACGGS
jgi:hypothetical protein